ncbi:hypothetical protein FJZ19_03060 [Candidatus Pacearchaeota archaeon]|nr:hypothetical protein [Candidatus Pacearchaeota archaeon]
MKILYFGNPHLEEDNLAVKVCRKLEDEFKNHEFCYIKDTFELIDLDLNDAIILDVVLGIDNVRKMSEKEIKQAKIFSLHDFDLGFFLKLKKKNIKIIGIPSNYSEEKAIQEIKNLIPN